MRILVTGAAGFIGFHLCRRLLADGHEVTGVDGMTAYYDPALKDARLAQLTPLGGFAFERLMLEDFGGMAAAFERARPEAVVHLAAQAGVRYSLENPARLCRRQPGRRVQRAGAGADRRASATCCSPRPARSTARARSGRSRSSTAPTTR